MIREGTPHLINAPWLSPFPGLAILVTVLGFNLLGDGLRDLLDPKTA
jgi:peptide/nickel transport system permease protein